MPLDPSMTRRHALGAGVAGLTAAVQAAQNGARVRVLERAGLVWRGRDAQSRPATLQPEPLREAATWIEAYRGLWEGRLDRLEDYLREIQSNGEK